MFGKSTRVSFHPVFDFSAIATRIILLSEIDLLKVRSIFNYKSLFFISSTLSISAEQIAELTSEDGAGFFVYYNSELDFSRLVYSTNLNDPTADLKIISRQTNLTGQDAIAALDNFSADNFEFEDVELAPTNVQDGTTSVA